MGAPAEFSALSADELLSEQQRLRALVYSRQAEAEPSHQHLDTSTGHMVQLRENEWRLLQLEREVQRRAQAHLAAAQQRGPMTGGHPAAVVPDAAATASGTAQSFVAPAALPRAPSPVQPTPPPPAEPQPPTSLPTPLPNARRRWLRVALIFAVGIAVGTGATLSATGVVQIPGFAAFAPTPPEPVDTNTPLPIPSEHADLLQVFTRGDTRTSTLPTVLSEIFPPDGIAIIYAPTAGNTGVRIYAARPDLQQLCLVAAIPTQQLAWRCGSISDVTRSGLHLRFWLADGLQQPPTTLGDGLDHSPTIADASWNPDGSFSVTQTPYG